MKTAQKGSATIVLILIALILIGAGVYFYSQNTTTTEQPNATTTPNTTQTKNEKLIAASHAVLDAIAKKDYQALEDLTSPDGLSLFPYPQVNLTKVHSTKDTVSDLATDKTIYLFGYTDGRGDPINRTTEQFLQSIMTNQDYSTAPQVAVNAKLGGGNSVFSLATDVAPRDFVAFHFPGFDPKYEGMDWTTAYLIFDNVGGEYKLRAIAKDNWTI